MSKENSLTDLADGYKSTVETLTEAIKETSAKLKAARKRGKNKEAACLFRLLETYEAERSECLEIAEKLKHYYRNGRKNT